MENMQSPGLTQTMSPEQLDQRLKTLLPEEYQECYESVQPVSMGSAALKYGKDGKVAWDQIWGSFCDLAMAGGPPHKGKLLEPATPERISALQQDYTRAAAEIRRGIQMTAYLEVRRRGLDGWLEIECLTPVKAAWLARAITMENISARCRGSVLELPAGPEYRVEKEIKNVVTSIAKTCHYWDDHISLPQQAAIRQLFAQMDAENPFLQVPRPGSMSEADCRKAANYTGASIERLTGLRMSNQTYFGWLGLECPHVNAAVWIMRALVAFNLTPRREETTLFIPVDPSVATPEEIAASVATVHRLAVVRSVV